MALKKSYAFCALALAVAATPVAAAPGKLGDVSTQDIAAAYYGAVLNYCVVSVATDLPLTRRDPQTLQAISLAAPDDKRAHEATFAGPGDTIWNVNRAKGFVYILEAADGKCRVMAYVPYGPTTDQAAQKTLTEFPRYVIDAVERILLSPTDYAMHRIPAPTPPMTVNYPAEVDNWYSRYINARGKPQRTLSVELHGGLSRSGPDKAPSEVILGGFVAFVPDAVPPIDQPSGQAAVRGDAPAH